VLRARQILVQDIHVSAPLSGVLSGCAVGMVLVLRSGSDLGLAGTTAGTLTRHDGALDEPLASPDSPGLTTFESSGQAGQTNRAGRAERFGVLHVLGRLGEEQLRVVDPAGELLRKPLDVGKDVIQRSELHRFHLLQPVVRALVVGG
jgi:hypothetical protein